MQDRGEQRRLGDPERLGDVAWHRRRRPRRSPARDTASATARGDLEVVALARAVGVDRGEQDLARAALPRPRVAHSTVPRAVSVVPARVLHAPALGVDRDDDRLRAELLGELGDRATARASAAELTETLSAPAREQRVGVGDRADAAADRERDRELLGDAPDDADERVALLERRLDVEEDELVGAAVGVGGAELDRVADVAQLLELDALDDAAGGDVEARDQARERDRSLTSASTRSR